MSHAQLCSPVVVVSVLAVLSLFVAPTLTASQGPPAAKAVAFDCTSVIDIPAKECEALVAFYNSTNGSGWTDHGGWLETSTPCSWFGVTCNAGHVTGLDMFLNNLYGTLPPQLSDLSELVRLQLLANDLIGTIPPELGNLSKLEFLQLGFSSFTGSIPPQLGHLSKVRYLELSNNLLTGSIPPELGNLTHVEDIILHRNFLTGTIPPELAKLPKLRRLTLFDNNLTGSIPPEFGNLTSLVEIDMDGDERETAYQLSGALPQTLTNLDSLDKFRFYMTGLCEPRNSAFQSWLAGIAQMDSTGIECPLLANLQVSGPATGAPKVGYTFIAAASPLSVTVPITYTWQATEQAAVDHRSVPRTSDSQTFRWTSLGSKAITVTAINPDSTITVTGAFTIEINRPALDSNLPLVQR